MGVVIVEGEGAVLWVNLRRPIVTNGDIATRLFPNYFRQGLFIFQLSYFASSCRVRLSTRSRGRWGRTFRRWGYSVPWPSVPCDVPTRCRRTIGQRNRMLWQHTVHTVTQVLADTNGPRDALHYTQSSSCCARSWTLSVIDRRRSSVDCWQHSATIDVPSQNYSDGRRKDGQTHDDGYYRASIASRGKKRSDPTAELQGISGSRSNIWKRVTYGGRKFPIGAHDRRDLGTKSPVVGDLQIRLPQW